jgi:transglutaminase-like putative cysteine protease
MEKSTKIQGWQIHHKEQLQYRAKAGSPLIRIKFYHYPEYRQKVQIITFPSQTKVKTKGINSYFLFNQKVHMKGTISLERKINLFPELSLTESHAWGKISNHPTTLQQKYQESFKIWPVKIPKIRKISDQEWFGIDELFDWVRGASRFVNSKIYIRENQEKRLGAYKAFLSGIGDCDEFTDLFITLARSRGIPCRRITGLYIANKGAFIEPHAWAEVLSPTLSWITVDLALNNIGNHTVNYVIQKIEEFNPELPDFQVNAKHSRTVHYQWDRPSPIVIPLY